MAEPILCLVAFIILTWVVLLKAEIQGLKQENRRLREALSRYVRDIEAEVLVSGSRRLPQRVDAGVRR